MVNLPLALSALSLVQSARQRSKQEEQQEQAREAVSQGENDSPDMLPADTQVEMDQRDLLEEIAGHQRTNNPSPTDKDAFGSSVVTLSPGATAEVTVEPEQGYHLLVKQVHFDRVADHSYEINVGGDISSVAHRAVYSRPKRVTQNDAVVGLVTNNSGSNSTIDFEIEAWAERAGGN